MKLKIYQCGDGGYKKMEKKFESNNYKTENPFNIALVKNNGELEEYYVLNEEAKEKITLADLINEQIEFLNKKTGQNASSGNNDQNASSRNNSQNASSGNNSQNASSGNNYQNASSGYNSKNASSGNNAKNASSGYYAQNASSGNNYQNASSGYNSKNASSGDYSKNASSGYYAQNASSGYYAQNASSGDYAQNIITGKNSVAFDCGFGSSTKAVNGTWISLCEYTKNKDGKYIPSFALSAQIGNHEYVDFKGCTLSEKEFYILKDKKFTPIILDDGIKMIKNSSKLLDGLEIIKGKELNNEKDIFCVRRGNMSAHGETLKEAMSDLLFKEMQNKDVSEIVKKIKESGYVTREDYRCITGACSFGTEKFAKEHGYENVKKVKLNELISKLDNGYYGAVKFKELFE